MSFEEESTFLKQEPADLKDFFRQFLLSRNDSAVSAHLCEVCAKETQSPMSFFGMIEQDGSAMQAHVWSPKAMAECRVPEKPLRFPIQTAGIWAEPIRRKETVIINDYATAKNRRGLPQGHVPITRYLGVPVLSGGRVIAVAAVANKADAYTEEDASRLYAMVSLVADFISVRRSEKEMADHERRLQTFIDFASDWEYWRLPDGRHLYDSPSCERLTGYTVADFLASPNLVHQIVHPEDKECFDKHVNSAHFRENKEAEVEFRIIRKDGTIRWLQHRCNSVLDEHGKWIGTRVSNRDVTEHKKTEQRILEDKRRLSHIIEGTRAGTWEWNVQTGEALFNDRWAEIVGYTLAELEPICIKTWEKLAHPDDLRKSTDLLEQHFAGKLPYYDCQCRMKHKDGRWVWIHDRGKVATWTPDGKPLIMLGTHTDITEKKQVIEALAQTEKLQSIGILAGGIAHDFNNLLQSVFGFVDMMKRSLERADVKKTADLLSKTSIHLERAQSLTQQLLTFSKGGMPVRKPQRLEDFVQETVAFALSGSNLFPVFDIPAGLMACDIDKHQISQVIDNLVINARHAMPLGGRLDVVLSNVTAEQAPAALPRKEFVRLSIRDFGHGIAPEHLPNIFVPFFTTKAAGSGLGLATCYSIVNKHEGLIEVESELGKGSVFYVYLPAANPDSIEVAPPSMVPQHFEGGLLLMDDEEGLREAMTILLTEMGFTVSAVADADEALQCAKKARQNGEGFKIAILDLTIPGGRGGKELVRELLDLDKTIQCIASSGYTEDPIIAKPSEYGFSGAIAKPYSISKLEPLLASLFAKEVHSL